MDVIAQTTKVDDRLDAKFEVRKALVCEAIDKYHNYLLSYACSLTRHKQDAEDIVGKLYEYALVHLPESKITQIGILRRKCYQIFVDWYRSRIRKREVITDQLPETSIASLGLEPANESEEIELEERFWSEFVGIELSGIQKKALWLNARFGYTIIEVSQMLDVPKSTIGDWLKIAKQKLKDYLEN